MATRTWDASYESTPADSDPVSEGAQRIRYTRIDTRERMEQGGHLWQETTNTYDGRHAVAADGSSYFTIYKSDKTSTALQISDTVIKPGSGLKFQDASGDDLAKRTRAAVWQVFGTVTTGYDQFIPIEIPEAADAVPEARAVIKTPPAGANMIIEIRKVGSGTDPTDANFDSGTLVATITISAGTYDGQDSSPATTTLTQYDRLIAKVTQVGSSTAGADLNVQLHVEY